MTIVGNRLDSLDALLSVFAGAFGLQFLHELLVVLRHNICERSIILPPSTLNEEVIIGNGFALTFLQCHFVNFVHHYSTKYIKLFGTFYLYMLNFEY